MPNLKLKRKDFKKVLKEGKKIKTGYLILKILPNNLAKIRVGVLIGKKISKKATIRNKIKRRLKELVRQNLEKIEKGLDLVFIPCPEIKNKNFIELKSLFFQILKKAQILKK